MSAPSISTHRSCAPRSFASCSDSLRRSAPRHARPTADPGRKRHRMIQTMPDPLVRHSFTAVLAALGIAGIAALVGEYGHRQITHAHRNDFRDDPTRWGMGAAEEIDLTAGDGVRLHSWLFRSPPATASVIVLHGHGGNKHTPLPLARMLYPSYNVLLLDHRGHGDSGGLRTTIGYEERLDVHAAVDVLVGRGLGPVG